MCAARLTNTLRRVWVGAEAPSARQQWLRIAGMKFQELWKGSETTLPKQSLTHRSAPVDGDAVRIDLASSIYSPDQRTLGAALNNHVGKRVYSKLD